MKLNRKNWALFCMIFAIIFALSSAAMGQSQVTDTASNSPPANHEQYHNAWLGYVGYGVGAGKLRGDIGFGASFSALELLGFCDFTSTVRAEIHDGTVGLAALKNFGSGKIGFRVGPMAAYDFRHMKDNGPIGGLSLSATRPFGEQSHPGRVVFELQILYGPDGLEGRGFLKLTAFFGKRSSGKKKTAPAGPVFRLSAFELGQPDTLGLNIAGLMNRPDTVDRTAERLSIVFYFTTDDGSDTLISKIPEPAPDDLTVGEIGMDPVTAELWDNSDVTFDEPESRAYNSDDVAVLLNLGESTIIENWSAYGFWGKGYETRIHEFNPNNPPAPPRYFIPYDVKFGMLVIPNDSVITASADEIHWIHDGILRYCQRSALSTNPFTTWWAKEIIERREYSNLNELIRKIVVIDNDYMIRRAISDIRGTMKYSGDSTKIGNSTEGAYYLTKYYLEYLKR
ncbi:MAG: hypothetical protein ABIJ92_01200 [Candidatus Aenigmatarchaeota archaeon]